MKNLLFYIMILFACLESAYGQSITWNWARQLNGPTNEEEIDAVASDANGNVFISGKFEQTIDIEGVDSTLVSAGQADIMFTKYDSDGTMVWTKHFGSNGEDNVFDAKCDSEGNIILSGYFEGTVTFDTITLSSWGETDMMVLKFNTDGNILWAKQMGGPDIDGGNEVSIGPHDRIIVAAESNGNFSADSYTFSNTGWYDAYLISMTSDGTVEWVRTVQGAGRARAKSVGTDDAGNSFLGGDFVGQNAIVAPSGNFSFNHIGLRDAYVTSWTPNGDLRWYKYWGGDGNELCKGITTNSKLEVYLVGSMEETVDFEGQQLNSAGYDDLFIWKTDSLGNSLWIRQISSYENLSGSEVVTDPAGGVIGATSIIGEASFQSNGDNIVVQTGGTRPWPALMQYNADGRLNHVKFPDDCYAGRFGEMSRTGNTIYLDVEYKGMIDFSGNIINTDQLSNRDGAIVSLSLDDETLSTTKTSERAVIEKLYSNPTKGQVSILLNKQQKQTSLHIYNSMGKLVQSKEIPNTSSFTFHLPQPSGIYLVKLSFSNGKTNVFKVIKE